MSGQKNARVLHRVSSLVLNYPASANTSPSQRKARRDEELEIVPDSEEERLKYRNNSEDSEPWGYGDKENRLMDVIEISSGEEQDVEDFKATQLDDPFLTISGNANPTRKDVGEARSEPISTPLASKARTKMNRKQTPRSRRIIQTSSEEDSDEEAQPVPIFQNRPALSSLSDVIELSSDSDVPPKLSTSKTRIKGKGKVKASPPKSFFPLYEDDDVNDESILILNDPKGSWKPIRINESAVNSPIPNTPKRIRSGSSADILSLTADRTPSSTRQDNISQNSDTPNTPGPSTPSGTKPNSKPKSTRKPRALSKKALERAEKSRLQDYAQSLFIDLNHTIFGDKLPASTELKWNKRLLTTAGRAKWHRTADGVQTTEIELAEKVLDSDERIRNTLSHEMCHLACWTIDEDPKENHGKLWNAWAKKVMRKRPDIEVTTRHDYEISYPYQWECQGCTKIYGRYSNSIQVDKFGCGVCKSRLVPLFTVRNPKAPPTQAEPETPVMTLSRMAAGKPRDSPQSLPLPCASELSVTTGTPGLSRLPIPSRKARYDDSDSDIEIIATNFATIAIAQRDGQ